MVVCLGSVIHQKNLRVTVKHKAKFDAILIRGMNIHPPQVYHEITK